MSHLPPFLPIKPSALTDLRSKQASPPLLHLDTVGLSAWDTTILDSDDLAGLWNAFTKCKKLLSDGYRLENITWRLWQREKLLVSGVKLNSDPVQSHAQIQTGCLSPTSTLQLSSPPLVEKDILSSPPCLSPLSPTRFTLQTPPAISRFSGSVLPSVLSPGLTLTQAASTHTPDRKPRLLHHQNRQPDSLTSQHHTRHLSDRSVSSPLSLSHILPPPRPNAITPVSLGVIIDTLLPMDLVAEQAHAKELLAVATASLSATAEPPLSSVLAPTHDRSQPSLRPSSFHMAESLGTDSTHSCLPPPTSPAHVRPSHTPMLHQSETPLHLKAPPRIVNIAPTPPSASPAVTAPTSPVIGPVSSFTSLANATEQFSTLHDLLTVSPIIPTCSPTAELAAPSQSLHTARNLGSASSGSSRLSGLNPRRPLSHQRYSSSSNTTSSLGFKSITTSPSVDDREERNGPGSGVCAKKTATAHASKAQLLQRRANSASGLKSTKRRPISYVRTLSGASTRSVSPRLAVNTDVEECNDDRCSQLDFAPSNIANPTPASSSPTPPTARPSPAASSLTPLLPSLTEQAMSYPEVPDNSRAAPVPSVDSPSVASSSLASLVSPVIPVTPNNSQASGPFQMRSSSASTGRSSMFLPSAPPPTPAENGAHLPTTMSAGINKSNVVVAAAIPPPAPPPTPAGAAAKKKAKFYINGYETEEETVLSPPMVLDATTVQGQTRSQAAGSVERDRRSTAGLRMPQEPVISEAPDEEAAGDASEGSNSDEWGSEYSDDEPDEEALERAEEIERRRQQEAYHRQLFAKKHFLPSPAQAPIRRAGLSMLFHPELNHLRHHPQPDRASAHPVQAPVEGPNRNQSAIELRHGLRGNSLTPLASGSGSGSAPGSGSTQRAPVPRPSSLIKSKSTIAVPVLAGQEPPVMVQRPPSLAGSVHQKPARHPSRLGARPDNVEFSDDDSDSDMEPETEAVRRRPEPVAPPLSPRTTRRNMLANEMTESVRRNLLWERQMRTQSMGIVPTRQSLLQDQAAIPEPREPTQEYKHFSKGFHRSGW